MKVKISKLAFYSLMDFFDAKMDVGLTRSVMWLCRGDKRIIRYSIGAKYATINISLDTENFLRQAKIIEV